MSLIKVRRIATLDAEAKDSIADKEREYTRLYELAQKNITFHAAKGDSAKVAEWKRKADEYKRLAQEATDAAKATDAKDSRIFKTGEKITWQYLDGEEEDGTVIADKGTYVEAKTRLGKVVYPSKLLIKENAAKARNAKDSRAADAKFKKGDKVVSVKTGAQGVVNEVYGEEKYAVLFNGAANPDRVEGFQIRLTDSRAADACGTDAKLQKGDKVRVWQYPVYGKIGEVVEATNGSMEYTVNVEGKDYPRIDYRRIVKVSNTAGDAADADNGFAFGIGEKVTFKRNGQNGRQWGTELTVVDRRHTDVQNEYTVKDVMGAKSKWWESWLEKYSLRAGDSASGHDAEEFRVGQKVKHTRFGTIGKVFEIAPDGGIGVQWSNGQAYYGKFHMPLSEIVAVDE